MIDVKLDSPLANSTAAVDAEYDLVIVGCGEGGKYLAWTLAKQDMRVLVVERGYIGGSCPNIACLPTKNLIHSAKVASYVTRRNEFGITAESVRISMSDVRERKRKMVDELVTLHLNNFKSSGATLAIGSARFVAPKTLEITRQDGAIQLTHGDKVIIGTGSRAAFPDLPGLKQSRAMTHVEALELDEIPNHLLILGGGYVGLEFAQAIRRFGSHVTVIDHNRALMHHEDPDFSDALRDLFTDEEINLSLGTRVSKVEGTSGDSVRLHVHEGGSKRSIDGSHLLISTGRVPNTESLALDTAGIAVTSEGFIRVDERLRTSAPDVWAVGDCKGGPAFTHISYDDFRVVRDDILGFHRVTTARQIPFCMFTDPEFARVGLSETEAIAQGISYRLARVPMSSVLRTRTLSETRGFMKALIASDSDRILGFTVFGTGAGEIMGAVQIAMIGGLPYTAVRDAIITHPTLLEGLIPLFSTVPPVPRTGHQESN